jgi:transposase-like protein
VPRGGIVNLLSGLSSARLVCHTQRMNTPSSNRYKNHRFPAEIISHGVWLYFRFCLRYRAENSHQPTRQRERRMQGFKSPGHAQRCLAAFGPIAHHFRPRRHRLSASAYRQELRRRFDTWQELTPPP